MRRILARTFHTDPKPQSLTDFIRNITDMFILICQSPASCFLIGCEGGKGRTEGLAGPQLPLKWEVKASSTPTLRLRGKLFKLSVTSSVSVTYSGKG